MNEVVGTMKFVLVKVCSHTYLANILYLMFVLLLAL